MMSFELLRSVFGSVPVLLVLVAGLSGCITETSGGLPGPAPEDERIAAQLDLARGYLERSDFRRAQAPLDKVLKLDANNVMANILSAISLHGQNEYELAEQHYKRALRAEPGNSQALYNYASFLTGQGRYADAVKQLEVLVKDTGYRARPQAFERLGINLMELERRDEAKEAFERALQLNVRLPRSNLELAELAFSEGDRRTAQSQLEFFNRLAQPNARSLCLGWQLAVAQKDGDKTASTALALKNLFPEQAGQCLNKS